MCICIGICWYVAVVLEVFGGSGGEEGGGGRVMRSHIVFTQDKLLSVYIVVSLLMCNAIY